MERARGRMPQFQLFHIERVVAHHRLTPYGGGVVVLRYAGDDDGGIGHGIQGFGHAGDQGQHAAGLRGQSQGTAQIVVHLHGSIGPGARLATQQQLQG